MRSDTGGARIVTASDDKTARIWDANTSKPVGEPLRHDAAVRAASFSADGTHLVTASADKMARIWDVSVDLKTPVPDWMPKLAEALGGKRLDERGVLVRPEQSIVELRKQLLALNGDDFWSRLGRWFFMRGPKRPDSDITVAELKRAQTEETTKDNLTLAKTSPGTP